MICHCTFCRLSPLRAANARSLATSLHHIIPTGRGAVPAWVDGGDTRRTTVYKRDLSFRTDMICHCTFCRLSPLRAAHARSLSTSLRHIIPTGRGAVPAWVDGGDTRRTTVYKRDLSFRTDMICHCTFCRLSPLRAAHARSVATSLPVGRSAVPA